MYPNPARVLPLPPRPNLEQYKKQAKDLVKACRSGDRIAIRAWAAEWIESLVNLQGPAITLQRRVWIEHQADQLQEFAHSRLSTTGSAMGALADAQFVIAQVHGFKSWPTFATHVEALAGATSSTSQFESAVNAIVTGDAATLKGLLRNNPELIRARSTREHRLTLLHYVGANGFEGYRQISPKNAVEVATILLNAGAEVDAVPEGPIGPGTALGMIATSLHTERAGVQIALLETLLAHGAAVDGAPGGWNPLLAALHNDRPQAAEFLAAHGARLDLEGAAGVGRLDVVKRFFTEDGRLANSPKAQMEAGFVWACEYGRTSVVEFLLERGVDLRAGENTGQTALHLAAHRGQVDMIKILLARGAPLEARNVYGGTVLGQATWSCMNSGLDIDYLLTVETLVAAGAKVEDADYPTGNEGVDEVLRRLGAKSA
jgi:hypothetical protein